MAYLATTAIRKRIREVLNDGHGLVRGLTQGRLDGDYWAGSGDWASGVRTLGAPRFDIPSMPIRPIPGAFEMGDFQLYELDLTIICHYDPGEALATDDDRDAVRATAEQDADVIRQALGWPGNMRATEAGDETGILDGYIRMVSFSIDREDPDARHLITRHLHTMRARVVTATS